MTPLTIPSEITVMFQDSKSLQPGHSTGDVDTDDRFKISKYIKNMRSGFLTSIIR